MKLNLDNYEKDLVYDKFLTEKIEDYIIENYIDKYESVYYDDYFKDEFDIAKFSNISIIGNSLLNWYDFSKEDRVLEIGGKLGNLTAFLCEKAGFVTSLEFSKKRGKAISKRLNKYENLEVIVSNFKNNNIENNSYDYVIIIGLLEYAPIFFEDSKNPYEDMILWAKSKLKENGKILLAFDNKLGVQYLSGCKSEFYDSIFSSVSDVKTSCFTKYGIEMLLKNLDLNNYKFYYPYPNYKITNVIYSDEYLMSNNSSKSKYNVVYNENSIVVMNELDLYSNLIKIGLEKDFSNSFLIEIGMNSNVNPIKFVSYNNIRKEKYRLMLKMDNDYARKSIINQKSIEHFNTFKNNNEELKKLGFEILDYYENNEIVSKVCYDSNFSSFLSNLKNDSEKELYINKWFDEIKSKLLVDSNFIETANDLHIVKKAYIDMIFDNTFIRDKKLYFIDQEWVMENVPVEFVLYRALCNYFSGDELNKFFEIFKLTKHLENFRELETKLQEEVKDEFLEKFFSRPYTFRRDVQELEKIRINNECEHLKRVIDRQKIEIAELKAGCSEVGFKVENIRLNLILEINKLLNDFSGDSEMLNKIKNLLEYVKHI